eukprot:7920032-Pyramimonas_sp.AAC.1
MRTLPPRGLGGRPRPGGPAGAPLRLRPPFPLAGGPGRAAGRGRRPRPAGRRCPRLGLGDVVVLARPAVEAE